MTAYWIALAAIVLLSTGACIVLRRLARTDGYNEGREYEQNRQAMRRLRETRAQEGIRSKTTLGAPSWYVNVSEDRRGVAMPGIPMAAFAAAPVRRGTATGEIRGLAAATDHFITRIGAEGDAYRRELSA